MSLRFFRRVRLAPGVTLNLSKSGASLSFGPRGTKLTLGARGKRATVGLPGTGLFYTRRLDRAGGGGRRARAVPVAVAPEARLTLGFFKRLVTPAEERMLVDGLRELVASHEEAALAHFERAAHLADGAYLAGFLALKRKRIEAATAHLQAARQGHRSLRRYLDKYGVQATLSLPVTAELSAWIEPGLRAVLLGLVECHQLAGRRREALAFLDRLRRLEPDDPVIKLSLAELLLDTETPERGACRRVLRLTEELENRDPIHAALLLYKARAMRGMGLDEAARTVLGTALRRRKDRSPELLHALRYERALCYAELGQARAARRDLERLYAEAPDYADVAARLGL